MRKLINMLKKNDNAYSVGRICAVIGFAVWVLVTLWLFCQNLERLRELYTWYGYAAACTVRQQGY